MVDIRGSGWDKHPRTLWRNRSLPQSASRPARGSSLGPSCLWWGADGSPLCPEGTPSTLLGSGRSRVGPCDRMWACKRVFRTHSTASRPAWFISLSSSNYFYAFRGREPSSLLLATVQAKLLAPWDEEFIVWGSCPATPVLRIQSASLELAPKLGML